MKKIFLPLIAIGFIFTSCGDKLAPVAENAIKPSIITEPTPNDTDDPAIWIHPTDASKSLIVGTDKEVGGLSPYGQAVNVTDARLDLYKRPASSVKDYMFMI